MGGVTIPLPALDAAPRPQPVAPVDALSEFQRAAQLQTASAQAQAIQAQTQGQQQQNQMQAMQLKDEQLRRQLAPQFVQKDSSGKPVGFDNEGLYNAMLQGGADPMSIQAMRMKQAEMQKSLIGLSDAQLEHQDKVNDHLYHATESVRKANQAGAQSQGATGQGTTGQPASPAASATSNTPPASPMGPAVPGTGGMSSGMLPNLPGNGAQPSAPPSGARLIPVSMSSAQAAPEPQNGSASTPPESSIQGASPPGARPINAQGQMAYQKVLIQLRSMGIPIGSLKPVISDESDLDQAEAELGLHKQQMNDAKEQAATAEAAGKGAQSRAEAARANIIPVPELGGVYHVDTGEFKTLNGQMMSPAMLESRYVMNQAQQKAGQSLSPADQAFDRGFEKFKTLVPTANINLQAGLLTPEAKQMAADYYSRTGTVPAGMRSPGAIASVLNAAAAGPNGAPDVATNKINYGAESALQKSATSGDMAKNITSFNTAIAHASQLKEAAAALESGDTHMLTAVGNQLGYQFGSDKTTNFNVIKNALSGEVSKVFKGGEATDAEIKSVQAPFDAANSPAQLNGAIDNAIHLMNSKRDALKDQYTQGMQGKPNFSGASQPAASQTNNFFSQFGGQSR